MLHDGLFFRYTLGHLSTENGRYTPSKSVFKVEYVKKGNSTKCVVLLTGLWDLKDVPKSRQNRSKTILVGENFKTRVHGSCSLLVVDCWYTCTSQTKPARGLNHVLAETQSWE